MQHETTIANTFVFSNEIGNPWKKTREIWLFSLSFFSSLLAIETQKITSFHKKKKNFKKIAFWRKFASKKNRLLEMAMIIYHCWFGNLQQVAAQSDIMDMWCTWEHFCFSLSRMVCIWDFLSALFALDVLWWWQQLMCSKFKFHYTPCHCCLKEIMLLQGHSATIFCLWYKMLLMFFPTLQITVMSGYIFSFGLAWGVHILFPEGVWEHLAASIHSSALYSEPGELSQPLNPEP